ncbi:MAG: hypothetical protein HN738_08425 [Gammaproteobacteria bacterium]|nr:hypothetical protein [Gammaproteobacteria bacterium]
MDYETDINTPQTRMEHAYLDWVNNYLTIETFAEHRGITIEHAKILIVIGREFNRRRIRQ